MAYGAARRFVPVPSSASVMEHMDRRGLLGESNTSIYVTLLQACCNTRSLKQVHAHLLINGLGQNVFWGTKLVKMYAVCGIMVDARLVFDKIRERNVFLWNAMVRGYAWNGSCEETLAFYSQMQLAGAYPNEFTFPFVLKVCAELSALQEGKEIHDRIVKTGLESDVYVGTALVDMYAKCGSIKVARQVFDKMPQRNAVSWNTMIAGYAQDGNADETLKLFRQMQVEGVRPDPVTLLSVLAVWANLKYLQQGKSIHNYIIRHGFYSEIFVGTALIDMYAKCGSIDDARRMFDKMTNRDVVSWNTMIAGYSQTGHANEALTLFGQMKLADVACNSVTMMSLLPACAHLAALQQGVCIHGYIIRSGFESDVAVGTALLVMYANFGNIEVARQSFDNIPIKDVVAWNAMITGYAQNGHGTEALTLFHQMLLADVTPDSVTMDMECMGLVAMLFHFFHRCNRQT